jgi:RES domain
MSGLGLAAIDQRTHRLIASRYPTIGVFDDIAASPDDLKTAFILEALTNDRLAPAAGRIVNLPDAEILSAGHGAGASIVMAAFLHASETGGRFTDGRLGAWYASFDLDTAIKETLHHNTERLKKSAGGFPNRIQMRELIAAIATELVDITGRQAERPELYDPDSYERSQAFAAELRWPKAPPPANGILFSSVRHQGGINACIFWPSKVLLPIIQGDHLEYHWDAKGVIEVMKMSGVEL